MKKSWNCSEVEIVHSILSDEEYDRLLDDWAEVVYLHLCQLSETKSLVPIQPALNEQKRTGTDG